jgi:hypothetical protein
MVGVVAWAIFGQSHLDGHSRTLAHATLGVRDLRDFCPRLP